MIQHSGKYGPIDSGFKDVDAVSSSSRPLGGACSLCPEYAKLKRMAGIMFIVIVLLAVLLAYNWYEVRTMQQIAGGQYITIDECGSYYDEGIVVTSAVGNLKKVIDEQTRVE